MSTPDENDALASGATVMAGFVAPGADTPPAPPPTRAPARPAPPAVGRLFAGRYELLRELGRGGMGVVYRARDTMVGDEVALKTLDIGQNPSDAAVERFRREVRLARRITHPNVARTHDLGDFEGTHYLTMEFVEGSDLAGLLARVGRLGPARAASIAAQVCEGLAAAHLAGVVHRDLKPANIIVEREGRVVLTDFGIARALATETSARTAGTIGTPAYMAPEQVMGGEVDARTDVYAVGLLLFEMLTGRLAFTGDSPFTAALARLREPAPDPRGLAPVPDALAELVLRCLEREPQGRPASARDVAEALRTWLSGQGDEPGQTTSSLLVAAAATAAPTQVTGARSTTTSAQASVTVVPGRTGVSTPTGVRRAQTLPAAKVAVLPLRYAGPPAHEYLGDALAEALIDVLGRTRGVEVAASGASGRFRSERDPRAVAHGLGVTYVVDATLQAAGASARITVRLLDAAAGVQLWSGRFDGPLDDPFALQDLQSQRIAETLRGELQIALFRDLASPPMIDAYRHARREVSIGFGPTLVHAYHSLVDHLREHPGFLPAVPVLAQLAVRAWFSAMISTEIDWQPLANAALADARRLTPDFPETAFAEGMIAVQQGEWRTAALALRQALTAAPCYPSAVQYLGGLKCEAGRADEGLPQLKLAVDLAPEQPGGLFEYARCSALRGDFAGATWAIDLLRRDTLRGGAVLLLEARIAAWTGDRPALQRVQAGLGDFGGPLGQAVRSYVATALGEPPPPPAAFEALFGASVHPRVVAMLCQIVAEAFCIAGRPEEALRFFQRAAEAVLIDLEWCDRCPVLTDMRLLPGFAELRRLVRERVEAIWAA